MMRSPLGFSRRLRRGSVSGQWLSTETLVFFFVHRFLVFLFSLFRGMVVYTGPCLCCLFHIWVIVFLSAYFW